jgi:phosphohistidine phosphatase SixA
MTKRLIILRHAKSSWTSGAPTDHQRPLNKRGRRDAPRIGARLYELGWVPELVISSDSERTQETWARLEPALPDSIDVHFSHNFYHGGFSAILDECSMVPDTVSTLMLIGHNPGWEDAVSQLCGRWVRMTTANAGLLETGSDSWQDAMESAWKLVDVLRPKEL